MRHRSVFAVLALGFAGFTLGFAGFVADAAAQEDDPQGYRTPPDTIARIAEAPPTPGISVSPDATHAVLTHRASLIPLAELTRPELRIAGLRLDPATSAASRRRTRNGLTLKRLRDGAAIALTGLPDPLRADHLSWSPDGARFAFTHTEDDDVELWVAEVAGGAARRVLDEVRAMFRDAPYHWLPDGSGLVARVAVEEGAARRIFGGVGAASRLLPGGVRFAARTARNRLGGDDGPLPTPVIQETTGRVAPVRTYQDLLTSPQDEALFLHHGTARVVTVDLDGKTEEIAGPGIIRDAVPSPDGDYLLVTTIHQPFSYLVPYSRFPQRIEVRDRDGAVVREVADLPLMEEIPIGRDSAPIGPRRVAWRGDRDATLVWIEARDGGDPHAEAPVRDELVQLAAPFEGDPETLLQAPLRLTGAVFGGGRGVAISRWWLTRAEQIWSLPTAGTGEPMLAFDTSYEDRYAAPGAPMTGRNERGARVLLTSADGSKAYLTAEGASPEGNRPFVDEWDLESGAVRRLFRSDADSYETPLALLDPEAGLLLTRRETRLSPPNYFLRDLGGAGEARAITDFPHPYPDLEGAGRELIRYSRDDGVELTALLHTPPGYDPARDGRLPLLVWAYPREYKSAAAAAQVRDSPQRFSFVSWGSALYWLTQGYAVMENATMPIIGEGDREPNDRYVEQLVASGRAAVDEAVRRGVADPERTAIAGHSYGAFMTANLLAHSDIFRAGIARSGAFNRTLTPFGFQSEQRTFWEAPEVYFRMSPFMHADQVNEPILLVHGAADNNSGTFPIQSRRFYHALKGHGAVARLVMLPHESHGYAARESVMHTLWEQHRWLERHVKNAPARESGTEPNGAR